MTDMERELDRALSEGLKVPERTPPRGPNGIGGQSLSAALAAAPKDDPKHPTPPPATRPQSLGDQLNILERIERELSSRVRREAIEAQCEAERKVADAHAEFARRLSEETARLERERDENVIAARDTYHAKLSELERLLRRRPAGKL
jgi:hypothetical protein